jgi:hypothetical protein
LIRSADKKSFHRIINLHLKNTAYENSSIDLIEK